MQYLVIFKVGAVGVLVQLRVKWIFSEKCEKKLFVYIEIIEKNMARWHTPPLTPVLIRVLGDGTKDGTHMAHMAHPPYSPSSIMQQIK